MSAIFKRELRAYFTSPLGYFFIGIYLMVSGAIFSFACLQNGAYAKISTYYTSILFAFVVLLPLLTMRSFAEERRQKTEQLLLTSPVTLPGMVLGKFFSAYVMFAGTFLIGCVNLIPYYSYSAEPPNDGMILGFLLAVLLVGGSFIALGLFVSALTENQLIAALGTMFLMLLFLLANFFNSYIPFAWLRTVCSWLSIYSRFSYFTYGVIDFSAVLYYVSVCFVFLFLTVRIYEKRRWD